MFWYLHVLLLDSTLLSRHRFYLYKIYKTNVLSHIAGYKQWHSSWQWHCAQEDSLVAGMSLAKHLVMMLWCGLDQATAYQTCDPPLCQLATLWVSLHSVVTA